MKALQRRRHMTAEELYHVPKYLPGVGDRFYELDRGVLLVYEPGGFQHNTIGSEILIHLTAHVRARQLGTVLGADTGFVLSRNPDTVRSPDVAFVAAARVPRGETRLKFFEGAPDLAVEVRSPGDRPGKIDRKVRQYLAAGTRAVWVVDPRARTVMVHRPDAIPHTLASNERLDGGDILPGFEVIVADLFPGDVPES